MGQFAEDAAKSKMGKELGFFSNGVKSYVDTDLASDMALLLGGV